MNKHFLRTLRRVCRDVEELAKRGHYEGTNTQYLGVSAALHSSARVLQEAVAIADYQPESTTEPQAATEQQEAQNGAV